MAKPILQRLALVEGSANYKLWMRKTEKRFLEIYLFNWTNVARFGEQIPNFHEVGPYVFEESIYPTAIEFKDSDEVVAFNETKMWKFRPELSMGNLNDRITNLNPVAAVSLIAFPWKNR